MDFFKKKKKVHRTLHLGSCFGERGDKKRESNDVRDHPPAISVAPSVLFFGGKITKQHILLNTLEKKN